MGVMNQQAPMRKRLRIVKMDALRQGLQLMKLNRHLMKLNLTNQKTKERLILDMVVLSERRILRYLNLKNWVHQKIDTHCSMTNFKAPHKFIHTFKTIPFTLTFSSFYTFYGFRFVRRNSLIVLL